MGKQSDEEIVRRVLAGDSSRFADLVSRHSSAIWAICRSRVSEDACEDIVQETFLRAFERLASLRDPSAFGAWLVQIARNQCTDWARAHTRRTAYLKQYEDEVASPGPSLNTPEQVSMGGETAKAVLDVIDTLPSDTREALFLYYTRDIGVAQAAQMLGTTRAAFRQRLRYGRKLLKMRLDREVLGAFALVAPPPDLVMRISARLPIAKGTAVVTKCVGQATGTKTLIGLLEVGLMTKKTIGLLGLILLVLAGVFAFRPTFHGPDNASRSSTLTETSAISTAVASRTAASLPAANEPVEEVVAASSPTPTSPAQTEAPPVPEPEAAADEKQGSIAGTVLDSAAYPLAGAEVTVEANGGDVIATGACGPDGVYRIDRLPPNSGLSVYAGAAGYLMERTSLNLTEGQSRDDVNFVLSPAEHFVAGWVLDSKRQPVAGARVSCWFYGYKEDDIQLMAASGGTTGTISDKKQMFAISRDDGFFELGVPEAGLCDLVVICVGYGTGVYPRIHTGTEDNVLQLASPGGIAGTVRDERGKPVVGATVRAKGFTYPAGIAPNRPLQTLPGPSGRANTDSRGEYTISGLSADYTYMVCAMRSASGAADVNLNPWDLTATPDEAILYDVSIESGRILGGVDLAFDRSDRCIVTGTVTDRTTGKPVCPVQVSVAVQEPGEEGKLRSSQTGTQPDGSYRLELAGLTEPCNALIHCFYQTQGGTVWNSNIEPTETYTLHPGNTEVIDLECDAPMSIPIRAVDLSGKGIPDLTSMIRLAQGSGWCGGGVRSDEAGRFKLDGLPARFAYVVMAADTSSGGLLVLGKSKPIEGTPGETVPEVTIVCRRRGGVEGILTMPSGEPLVDARVTVPPSGTETRTDTKGYFCFVDAFPEGILEGTQLVCTTPNNSEWETILPAVDISAGMITNVGALIVSPPQREPTQSP